MKSKWNTKQKKSVFLFWDSLDPLRCNTKCLPIQLPGLFKKTDLSLNSVKSWCCIRFQYWEWSISTRCAGVTLLILVYVSSMWSYEGEKLVNMAVGPSNEARATELGSLQSGDRNIVVSFNLTNFNGLSSVQLRQQPFCALSSQGYGCFLTEASPNIKVMLKQACKLTPLSLNSIRISLWTMTCLFFLLWQNFSVVKTS